MSFNVARSPGWAESPRMHSTHSPTRAHENAQHAAARATIDVQSRRGANPRSTRFVSGKAITYRRRTRRYDVDPWSRRQEVAHGVLRSSLKPENFVLPICGEEGSKLFVVCLDTS